MDLTDRAIGKFRKRLASALCIRQTQTLCIQQTLCRRDDYRQKQSKDSQNSKKWPLVYQSLQLYQDCNNSVRIVKSSQTAKMTIGVPIVTGLPRLYQQCTNRQKQSNSKNDHWCTNGHISTQSPPNTQSLHLPNTHSPSFSYCSKGWTFWTTFWLVYYVMWTCIL